MLAPLPIEIKLEEGSDQSYTASHNTLSKRPPKNYLVANRRALKEQQQSNKNAQNDKKKVEQDKQMKIKQKKQQQFGSIKSKVFAQTTSSLLDSPDGQPYADTDSVQPFPFSHHHSDDDTAENQEYHIAFGRKMPTSSASSTRPKQKPEKPSGDEGFVRHKSFGKTPAYITNRKARREQEEERRLLMEQNKPPAPGLVLLEEHERLETLRILEEQEAIERDKLRNIPFAMNGHRAARLREAIEFRLKEIEDTKRIFSKDRVFVAQRDD